MEDQGVWEIMEPSGESSEQGVTVAATAKVKDKKARAHLLQCLPDDLLMPVAANKTRKEVLDSLKERFVDEECVREAWLQTLKSEFDAMKMKEEESIDHTHEEDVRTVPERFVNVVAGIEQFYDLKKLAFEEAVGWLKAYEERTKRGAGAAVKSDTDQVLLTQAEWEARQKRAAREAFGKSRSQESGGGSRGRGRGRGGSSGGRGGQGDVAKDGVGKRDKSHIKIFKCHKYGHYANRCPGAKKKEEEAHHASAVEYEPTVLLAETALPGMLEHPSSDSLLSDGCQGELFLNEVKVYPELHYTNDGVSSGDVWYLDNGASNHMIGDRQKFRDMDTTVSGKVSRWRADEPLELLHIDLCGPITPETAGGNKYFMLIVDDCTSWMTVSVLKTKDQASDAFAKFKAEAKNSLGHKVKCVRSDRGGEFLVAVFKDICEQAGIMRQLIAPYSPQQHGVVERRNRTVMEMARSLMKSINVPGMFWGEAVRHSVHLLNRLPTKPMGCRTPFEAWNGRKPQLGHLRVFGCKAHVRPARPHLKKLDDRSVPMVYFGVEDGSKEHRLYDPQSKKIVVSRDVVFEEGEAWKWNAEFGENSEFVIDDTVGVTAQQWDGVVAGENNQDDHLHDDSGGASGGVQDTGDVENLVQHGTGALPDTVHIQATDAENSMNHGADSDQGDVDDNMDVDHDDGPVRFRSLNDVYQDSVEVDLASDTEVETNALLAVMEEPTCYQEVAGNDNWMAAMDNEI
ncbi:uncharacterized protein [Miscanthus floridulus]|uniref:uncharacterized protein n=1 Tax=Miscanthus floridulus TaxID=154761 RepID=UPI003458CD50